MDKQLSFSVAHSYRLEQITWPPGPAKLGKLSQQLTPGRLAILLPSFSQVQCFLFFEMLHLCDIEESTWT